MMQLQTPQIASGLQSYSYKLVGGIAHDNMLPNSNRERKTVGVTAGHMAHSPSSRCAAIKLEYIKVHHFPPRLYSQQNGAKLKRVM